MHQMIRLLPHHLADQIAAGEVVQRPASIVKELLENAVDAQSTSIKVVIKEAGKVSIQVIDNGVGMSTQNARMSFKKHATSKIRHTKDLSNIKTLGFRGEALAAIAAVAQVEMETRPINHTLGTRIIIQGSKISSQEPVVTTPGTHIKVNHLFFNIPARRNFLKSDTIEFKHIIEEFQRVALANAHIALTLYKADQLIYQLPADKLSHRITHLFGEAYKSQLIPCKETTDLLTIHGYIGKPEYAKKTRGEQFFIVNQRFIRSPYLHNAVQRAFEGLIPDKVFPFYVLFINVPPDKIDVNVHPTKTEVKFEHEPTLYAVTQAMIKKALAQYHITPSLDFTQNVNLDPLQLYASIQPTLPNVLKEEALPLGRVRPTVSSLVSPPKSNLHTPESMHNTPFSATSEAPLNTPPHEVHDLWMHFVQNATKIQLHQSHILMVGTTRILCVDQHAAHERILYEKYLRYAEKNDTSATQQLLFPTQVRLNPVHIAWLQDHQAPLQALGFIFSHLSTQYITITGCPPEVMNDNLEELIADLLVQGQQASPKLDLPTTKVLAQFFAKRGRLPKKKILTLDEMDKLVQQLFACHTPTHTPTNQKTFIELTAKDVLNWFTS